MFWYLQAAGSMLRFFWYLLRPKKPSFNAQKCKKLICIFCPFLRAEMTSWHKNSSKTLQNTPKMVQNFIKGLNIYIGRPSKKKNHKIETQILFFILWMLPMICVFFFSCWNVTIGSSIHKIKIVMVLVLIMCEFMSFNNYIFLKYPVEILSNH